MTTDDFPSDSLSRILTAIETIEKSLAVLARKRRISRAEYKDDSDTRDIVERRFVKMTEASIDIGEELVKYERGEPPASNPEAMRDLGEMGILSPTVAEEMAQGARFRNVLSYTYGDIIEHDLRNPMNVANGRLELATEECDSEHLAAVADALARMETLIEDLLTLTRQGETPAETVDIADIVETSWQNIYTCEATLVSTWNGLSGPTGVGSCNC